MSEQFPIYRKYSNGLSYFKILGVDHCVELQRIGQKVLEHQIKAEQYPEKVLIRNLIDLQPPAIECTEEEFESLYKT